MRRSLALLLSAAYACAADSQNTTVSDIQSRTGHPVRQATAADLKASRMPPGIDITTGLTENDAVAIALWNNPALHADLANLGLAQADLIEAGLLRNPNLSVLFPVGAKPFELILGMPVDAIWQRPRRVAAAKLNYEAISQGLVQHGLDLARDARAAHADLALAQQRGVIFRNSADLRNRIADLTARRVKAGDASEYELGVARLDAKNAEDLAARNMQDLDIARERLRMLMGLRGDRGDLPLKQADPARSVPEVQPILETAFASRPDLRAAEIAVQAATARAKWERSRIVNLTLMLSTKGVGSNGILSGPGAAGDIPIFNRNQGGIHRADAEVQRASLQYLAIRDRVELETLEARDQFVQASAALDRVRSEILPAATRTFELANKAYANGEVSYLYVLENSRQLIDAQMKDAEALAALRRASAQLERSIGKKI